MSMSESNKPVDAEQTDEKHIPKSFYILFAWLTVVTLGGLFMILVPDVFRAIAEVFL